MNIRILLTLSLLTLCKFSLSADHFRIIGYLPTYRFSTLEKLEVEKLTHLNLAFAQATYDGKLVLGGNFNYIVSRSKERNPDLKVLVSLAGGGIKGATFANWRRNMAPGKKTEFIRQIMDFVRKNNFDGVDVDLEWGNVTPEYPGFVAELSDSLRSNNLEISAAFPAMKLYSVLNPESLKMFDYINIMAYDNSGPWQPRVVRQHSSYELAQNSIDFWAEVCQLPKEKIVLGIPCYGWEFGKSVKSKTFSSLVSEKKEFAFTDNIRKIFYNSIPTIIEKTKLARERCGGVMLWEIGQDAIGDKGDYSLLHFVHTTALTEGRNFLPKIRKFTIEQSNESIVSIRLEDQVAPGSYLVLEDIIGTANQKIDLCHGDSEVNVDLTIYPRGVYVISLIEPGALPRSQRITKL
ncbi:MAG TPA: glycosyl hydrolase family 18 protein [Saprospiraceae bacterium]|nr:glycosyl hydrolase family 18 protein [Saprospiraceae bacterium]HRP84209.1 glycosyl hydrolase family 18 protein [Saprospiraceae bacterium]